MIDSELHKLQEKQEKAFKNVIKCMHLDHDSKPFKKALDHWLSLGRPLAIEMIRRHKEGK